jgi:magnesium chelatase subunit I
MSAIYPFVALVGQDDMKLSLILNVINPGLSGVLIRGEKGTGKSTAARSLAEILPEIKVVKSCPFNLAPDESGTSFARPARLRVAVSKKRRQVRLIASPGR